MSSRFYGDVLGMMGLVGTLLAIGLVLELIQTRGPGGAREPGRLEKACHADSLFLEGQDWGRLVCQVLLPEPREEDSLVLYPVPTSAGETRASFSGDPVNLPEYFAVPGFAVRSEGHPTIESRP